MAGKSGITGRLEPRKLEFPVISLPVDYKFENEALVAGVWLPGKIWRPKQKKKSPRSEFCSN